VRRVALAAGRASLPLVGGRPEGFAAGSATRPRFPEDGGALRFRLSSDSGRLSARYGASALRPISSLSLKDMAFPEQLKYRTPHGRPMKKMLHAALIADEAEAFVDQQARNRAAGHD
jgi:hypothetical protein